MLPVGLVGREMQTAPNARPVGGENRALAEADIRVADVFRGHRQEDFFERAARAGIRAGEQIEQNPERRLTAVGDRDVGGGDSPTETVRQMRG